MPAEQPTWLAKKRGPNHEIGASVVGPLSIELPTSFDLFGPLVFAEADAGGAAVLVDELDAGPFESRNQAARGETSRSILRRSARPAISKS
jgi:hypothetical protein